MNVSAASRVRASASAGTPAARPRMPPSSDAATGAGILQSLFWLRGCEAGEADQVAMLDTAIGSLQDFIRAESEEPDPDIDAPAYMSAVRAGARNSAGDQAHIDAIHQHATALGASAHSGDEAEGGSDDGEAEAARSGDPVRAIRFVRPVDPDEERQRLSLLAAEAGETAYRSFTA